MLLVILLVLAASPHTTRPALPAAFPPLHHFSWKTQATSSQRLWPALCGRPVNSFLTSCAPCPPCTPQLYQHVGLTAIRIMRRAFDVVTGYGPNMTEAKWLQRMIFLETVAGVPGMVAGMLRHLKSLRTMQRDHGGWRTEVHVCQHAALAWGR